MNYINFFTATLHAITAILFSIIPDNPAGIWVSVIFVGLSLLYIVVGISEMRKRTAK